MSEKKLRRPCCAVTAYGETIYLWRVRDNAGREAYYRMTLLEKCWYWTGLVEVEPVPMAVLSEQGREPDAEHGHNGGNDQGEYPSRPIFTPVYLLSLFCLGAVCIALTLLLKLLLT